VASWTDPGASLKINVTSGPWSDFATGEKGGDPPDWLKEVL